MGLTTRDQQAKAIIAKDPPHYYEVKLTDHPNGLKQMHCGTKRDLESVLSMNPGATWEKIYLPHTPDTVNIQATDLGKEEQLKEAVPALPESELEEFIAL